MVVRPEAAPSTRDLALIRHAALDMDGTIYSGHTLFPFTIDFLQQLTALGIGYTFLTNNSSKSRAQYLDLLRKRGIPVEPSQLYTSTDATIKYLAGNMPSVRKLFVLGTEGLRQDFGDAGFVICEDSSGDEPDAVIAGFDTDLIFSRLCRACYWVKEGKPFIATHPDLVCPTDQPTVLVDCGAVCAAIEKAAGRGPDVVLGKPDPCMLEGLLALHGLASENLAMVGDRLYTDMAMAKKTGAVGVLVLTGEATAEEAAAMQPPPDFVLPSLAEFGNLLASARAAQPQS